MGVVDRSIRRLPSHLHSPKLKEIPNQSLDWIINQEKSELNLLKCFSFVGYEFHLDSALVKPSQERWLKFQELFLPLKSKHVFDYKMFDVANWVACLRGEMVLEGCLHMRPIQFHLKEYWRFPQSLDSLLPFSTPKSKPLQGSVVRPGNKATHKCSRAEGIFSDPSKVQ